MLKSSQNKLKKIILEELKQLLKEFDGAGGSAGTDEDEFTGQQGAHGDGGGTKLRLGVDPDEDTEGAGGASGESGIAGAQGTGGQQGADGQNIEADDSGMQPDPPPPAFDISFLASNVQPDNTKCCPANDPGNNNEEPDAAKKAQVGMRHGKVRVMVGGRPELVKPAFLKKYKLERELKNIVKNMFLGTLSPPGGDNNLPEPLVKKDEDAEKILKIFYSIFNKKKKSGMDTFLQDAAWRMKRALVVAARAKPIPVEVRSKYLTWSESGNDITKLFFRSADEYLVDDNGEILPSNIPTLQGDRQVQAGHPGVSQVELIETDPALLILLTRVYPIYANEVMHSFMKGFGGTTTKPSWMYTSGIFFDDKHRQQSRHLYVSELPWNQARHKYGKTDVLKKMSEEERSGMPDRGKFGYNDLNKRQVGRGWFGVIVDRSDPNVFSGGKWLDEDPRKVWELYLWHGDEIKNDWVVKRSEGCGELNRVGLGLPWHEKGCKIDVKRNQSVLTRTSINIFNPKGVTSPVMGPKSFIANRQVYFDLEAGKVWVDKVPLSPSFINTGGGFSDGAVSARFRHEDGKEKPEKAGIIRIVNPFTYDLSDPSRLEDTYKYLHMHGWSPSDIIHHRMIGAKGETAQVRALYKALFINRVFDTRTKRIVDPQINEILKSRMMGMTVADANRHFQAIPGATEVYGECADIMTFLSDVYGLRMGSKYKAYKLSSCWQVRDQAMEEWKRWLESDFSCNLNLDKEHEQQLKEIRITILDRAQKVHHNLADIGRTMDFNILMRTLIHHADIIDDAAAKQVLKQELGDFDPATLHERYMMGMNNREWLQYAFAASERLGEKELESLDKAIAEAINETYNLRTTGRRAIRTVNAKGSDISFRPESESEGVSRQSPYFLAHKGKEYQIKEVRTQEGAIVSPRDNSYQGENLRVSYYTGSMETSASLRRCALAPLVWVDSRQEMSFMFSGIDEELDREFTNLKKVNPGSNLVRVTIATSIFLALGPAIFGAAITATWVAWRGIVGTLKGINRALPRWRAEIAKLEAEAAALRTQAKDVGMGRVPRTPEAPLARDHGLVPSQPGPVKGPNTPKSPRHNTRDGSHQAPRAGNPDPSLRAARAALLERAAELEAKAQRLELFAYGLQRRFKNIPLDKIYHFLWQHVQAIKHAPGVLIDGYINFAKAIGRSLSVHMQKTAAGRGLESALKASLPMGKRLPLEGVPFSVILGSYFLLSKLDSRIDKDIRYFIWGWLTEGYQDPEGYLNKASGKTGPDEEPGGTPTRSEAREKLKTAMDKYMKTVPENQRDPALVEWADFSRNQVGEAPSPPPGMKDAHDAHAASSWYGGFFEAMWDGMTKDILKETKKGDSADSGGFRAEALGHAIISFVAFGADLTFIDKNGVERPYLFSDWSNDIDELNGAFPGVRDIPSPIEWKEQLEKTRKSLGN